MGILDRYRLHLKRPTADGDWASVRQNLHELERWANILPIPDVQSFQLTGLPGLTTSYAKLISLPFRTSKPNTVICADLFVDCAVASGGGGSAIFRGAIDGTFFDAYTFATFNEASVAGTATCGHVGTVLKPGVHELEVWGKKTINAGSFNKTGAVRLWTF